MGSEHLCSPLPIFVPCPCVILFLLSAPLMGRAAALIPYALSLKHLFATGELDGLRGSVRVSNTGAVSGTVQAGVAESSLRWLPDATKTVFAEKKNGLY